MCFGHCTKFKKRFLFRLRNWRFIHWPSLCDKILFFFIIMISKWAKNRIRKKKLENNLQRKTTPQFFCSLDKKLFGKTSWVILLLCICELIAYQFQFSNFLPAITALVMFFSWSAFLLFFFHGILLWIAKKIFKSLNDGMPWLLFFFFLHEIVKTRHEWFIAGAG